MNFSALGLTPALCAATRALGYLQPTPIQAAALAPALAGTDVLASAQTGSGKTLAFALALLQHLRPAGLSARRAQALVLAPTRELAMQVGEVIAALARHLPQAARVSVLYGGVSINPQMLRLRSGTDVVVATPGRLLDLVAHNALSLSAVSLLVLDEADRMLELGFADELAQVLALLPAQRQSLFFSATFSPAVQALARALLHEPMQIEQPGPTLQPVEIVQRALAVDADRRTQLLGARAGVCGHQIRRRGGGRQAAPCRPDGRAVSWRTQPGQTQPGAGRLQGRAADRHGGHRHGGARARHCRFAGGGEF